jgi:peptide deformylase
MENNSILELHLAHSAQVMNIHTYPDPVLKKIAEPVTEFNHELKNLCLNMLETMYQAPGIGLAAPQVGVSRRIFVLDVSYRFLNEDEDEDEDEGNNQVETEIISKNPYIFINPEIVEYDGATTYQEGCLSVPGIFEEVNRHKSIKLKYCDLDGNSHYLEADGLLAICIQHELDHLNGIVFIERLSGLKRNFLKKKLLKVKR